MKLASFDVSYRTAYAQAKELAMSQTHVPLVTPGSLQIERRREGTFVYRYRYDATGKRLNEYLGAESDAATQAKVQQAEAEIADGAAIAQASRDLRKIGFNGTDNSALVTVAVLFNAGIFGHGGILIGTHAFAAILNELGISGAAMARTEDLDLVRLHRIEIAGLPQGGFLDLLSSSGLEFIPVPHLERRQPSTSFRVRGKPLKVDLLVPAALREAYESVAVPELGAHATGLPYLRYLLEKTEISMLLGRDRIVPVTIPDAGRFCLHKLVVHALRGGDSKAAKDVQQASLLAAALSQEREFLLTDALDAMSQGMRSKARAGARKAIEQLGSDHPRATDFLQILAK